MSRIFAQTGTPATLGAIGSCALGVNSVANSPATSDCSEGGVAGGAATVQHSAATNNIVAVMFQLQGIDATSWEAGNWTVRINVTTAGAVTWTRTYLCRVDSGGTGQATVGSLTGQSISMNSTGVKSMTISGSAQTAAATDDMYIVCMFDFGGSHGNTSFGITLNQNIDTPLIATSISEGDGSSDGVATVDGVGSFEITADGSSDGLASVNGEGGFISEAIASSDGAASVSGESIVPGVLEVASVGTISEGTTSVTPALPSGIQAGDLLAMFVVNKYNEPDTPSGWTLAHRRVGGSGASGPDAGFVYGSLYTRIADGSDTAPTVTAATITGECMSGVILRVTKALDNFDLDATSGVDDVPGGNTWAAALLTNVGFQADDLAVIFVGTNSDNVTAWNAHGISGAGLTMGSYIDHIADGNATGHDCFLLAVSQPVTAGTQSAAGQHDAGHAAGGTNFPCGVSLVLRVRETSGGSISSGDGSSDGVATVAGVGAFDSQADGSVVGTAAVAGDGAFDSSANGSASGSAAVAGVGVFDSQADGDATGVAVVSGDAEPIYAATGSVSGEAVTAGVGAFVSSADGDSSSTATITGIGAFDSLADGTAVGLATVTGDGNISSVGTAQGSATALGEGSWISTSTGSSSGAAIVSGDGSFDFEATASATGSAAVSGSGESSSVGTAAGITAVLGVGAFDSVTDGSATGTSASSGVGAFDSTANSSAAGVATVFGSGSFVSESDAAAAGSSSVLGVSGSASIFTVSTGATVAGQGEFVSSGDLSADGTAAVDGVGSFDSTAEGLASGSGTVAGDGSSLFEAVGESAGSSSVIGQSQTDGSVGVSVGVATATGVGSFDSEGQLDASGTSAVAGAGSFISESAWAVSGSSTVEGFGTSLTSSLFAVDGIAAVQGIGSHSCTAEAAGLSSVTGLGSFEIIAIGSSSGLAVVLGSSDIVVPPADLSVIRIRNVQPGTVLRVQTISMPRSTKLYPIALFRVIDGGETVPIHPRSWRKIWGLVGRRFVAHVLANDPARKRLTLQIVDASTTNNPTTIRYNVVLPYERLLRVSRLVRQGRKFVSVAEELAYRRKHRSRAMQKFFFDPKDRFVPVSLL